VSSVAILNWLACLGWSAINVIVGAQLIHAVNSDVPGWAAILFLAAGTLIVAVFGYKVVHYYETVSWIPCFIVFLLVLGEFARSGSFSNVKMGTGRSEMASVLSFSASVFAFATSWSSLAADYACYQPVATKRWKIIVWVFVGLMFPLCFLEMLGLAIGTATANNESYLTAYNDNRIGGLLATVLLPRWGGFGKFLLVVLALSTVGANCPNMYSLAFSLQVFTRHAQKVPRFIWTFVGTLIYVAIAIPGYSRFESVLENLLLILVR
jgi:purine-cytosine permease-like protein